MGNPSFSLFSGVTAKSLNFAGLKIHIEQVSPCSPSWPEHAGV